MKVLCVIFTLLFASNAEYNGQNIDGQEFDCTAFSYSTGNYYYVTVEFEADEVTLTFENGNTLILQLDDEVIDDPNSIEAFDYARGIYWDLEIEGLD